MAPGDWIEPVGIEPADVADPGDAVGDDDVISSGARPLFERARIRWSALAPNRRRRLLAGALALVLAGAGASAGVAIARSGPSHRLNAAPTPPIGPTGPVPVTAPRPRSSYDPFADATSAVGPPYSAPGGAVRDVAVAGTDLYVVSASAVSLIDTYTRQVLRQAPVTSPAGVRVVLDQASGTLWIVDVGPRPGPAREFDLVSLRQIRSVAVPGEIYAATGLDQRLYVATSNGVYLIAPGSTTLTAVAASIPPIQAISPDPARHTLLGVTSGTGARIITIGDEGATVRAGSTITVSSPTIAVLDDALWVGSLGGGGRLERVDEATLRPLPESAGGVIVDGGSGSRFDISAGVNDLWVYNTTGQELYCVDSHSGLVLQRWAGIDQSVASGGSGPFVVSSGVVAPLVLRGNCQG